jgi:hypothetical protein
MSDDPRISILRNITLLEPQVLEAKKAAKEAASRANRIECELMNARHELYRLLGVEEHRPKGERVAQ